MATKDVHTLLGEVLAFMSCRLPANAGREDLPKYNYPSAGHCYPVQALVFIPQDNELFYYHPLNNCLMELPTNQSIPLQITKLLQKYTASYEVSSPTPARSSPSPTKQQQQQKTVAYMLLVAERNAIEPVYGSDLSLEFCYLEAGYIEELLQMGLDTLQQTTSTHLYIKPSDYTEKDTTLHEALGLTESQLLLHILTLHTNSP